MPASVVPTQKTCAFPTLAVVAIALSCCVCTFGLLFGAFSALPHDDTHVDCASPDTDSLGDAYRTVLIFALGYVSTLAAKRRHDLARKVDGAVCTANAWMISTATYVASVVASARSTRLSLQRPSWMNKDVMAIAMTSVLCSSCILGLIVSAFTAEAGAEEDDVALASESSTTMRVFTVGWMFILSFKLRSELLGVIGSCCLLQPW